MAHGLVDIGANLTHDSFDADRDEVIQRAVEAGVTSIVVTGASAEGSRQALQLARRYPDLLYATAGIHPHHASEYEPPVLAELRSLTHEPEVVAVGECGLDYFRNFSSPEDQLEAFEAQLRLASDEQLPVFLHQRDAHKAFVSLLNRHRNTLVGGVAHCFTGTTEELRAYLDLDLHIGITGWICDERRGLHLREVVQQIPLDRLLLETDAPYLLPRDLDPKPKSRRNEPLYLPHILGTVAECTGHSATELAAVTSQNARSLFGINKR